MRVLAVTGIRSEYDILYPVLRQMQSSAKIDLKVVASSAHLSEWHGFTLQRIYDDGFEVVDCLDTLLSTNRITQRAKGIGLLVYSLSQTVERVEPDVMMVVGDREESIATAVVGNYMKVLTAHLAGGDDLAGNDDDPVRFAVTKLSHLHFPFAQAFADNLLRFGEEEFRIFAHGNPSLDNIRLTEEIDTRELSNRLGFEGLEPGGYLVMINHPVFGEAEGFQQMSAILSALEDFCTSNKLKVIGTYPNTDPGAYDIIRAIEEYQKKDFIQFFKTLPTVEFVNALRHARAFIGNSSMGILEAPYYKLPVVHPGNRQKGRLNAGNVEFTAYDKDSLVKALNKACFDETYRQQVAALVNPYGDGFAADKICQTLEGLDINDSRWYIKKKMI